MADPVVVVGAFLLGLVALVASVFALRHRLAWRIAVRNFRRGRGRTVLVMLGLLVGTAIISGSLVVGSTLSSLELHYTYIAIGNVHEVISEVGPTGANRPIAYSTYLAIVNGSASDGRIAGFTPMIISTTQVYDRSTGLPETALNLVGSNANQSSALGPFHTVGGQTLAGPTGNQTYLDQQTAEALNASVGDHLVIYGPTPVSTTLTAIVAEDDRGGFLTAGISPGDVFVDLATAQQVENLSGKINFIAVTNTGGQVGGLADSVSISAALNATLATIPAAKGLSSQPLLWESVQSAESSASGISTIFLVLGLFSIAAGAMLIVGIFFMLAEERKGEMGMLRAIGLRRRDLVLTYYFEGLLYAGGSALLGAAVGVLAGLLLTEAFAILLAGSGLSAMAIVQSFTVTPDDLVLSYVSGFLLTIGTVAVASSRVSRLNIVHAIRDIPTPRPPRRFYRLLAYIGAVVAVVGALLLLPNARGSSDISIPILGGGLLIIGLGLVASRFLPNRLAFSAVGLGLLVWSGFEPLHQTLLGTAHSGTIFIVFVEGILMVAGAIVLYIFNARTLTDAITRLAGRNSRPAPVTRVALSYPSRRPGPTTVNLTIFALVTFTMVAIACFGASTNASLSSTIQTESGGYTFFGGSALPIPHIAQQIQNNSTLDRDFAIAVPLVTGAIEVGVPGSAPDPFQDALYAAPGNQSPVSDFYSSNQFGFYATWEGWSASRVWTALQGNASVAVVDHSYMPSTSSVSGGGPSAPHPTLTPGAFVQVHAPGSSTNRTVQVIGVLAETSLTGLWLNPGTAASLGYTNETGFLLTIKPGVSAVTAAQDAKRAFLADGLVLYDITAILESSIASTEGFIDLLEIFIGLGLAVGIAAMGILAMRSVTERRREIGMLRAMGFTESSVLRAYLLEFSFVTLLGLGIGTALGIWIVYDLTTSSSASASGVTVLSIPVLNLVLILVAAYLLSMAAVAAPSHRASRLPPADAVRPTE